MPSPFPGMDPFLEHSRHFYGLQFSMIVHLEGYLQSRLPEPYFAATGSRSWIEVSRSQVAPRVTVGELVKVQAESGSDPVVVQVPHDQHREIFLNIFRNHNGRERLVTRVEIPLLTTKTPGEHGRHRYLRAQRKILRRKIHLVEIDLLRAGQHSTAVPLDRVLEITGPFAYHVCAHHFNRWEEFFVWPIRLVDRLPEIAIPLLPGDLPVQVDLQAIFDRCYDAGPYRRCVHYQENAPVPPLQPEQAEWATRLLKEKGLLPVG